MCSQVVSFHSHTSSLREMRLYSVYNFLDSVEKSWWAYMPRRPSSPSTSEGIPCPRNFLLPRAFSSFNSSHLSWWYLLASLHCPILTWVLFIFGFVWGTGFVSFGFNCPLYHIHLHFFFSHSNPHGRKKKNPSVRFSAFVSPFGARGKLSCDSFSNQFVL